jgi:hypothetical protein
VARRTTHHVMGGLKRCYEWPRLACVPPSVWKFESVPHQDKASPRDRLGVGIGVRPAKGAVARKSVKTLQVVLSIFRKEQGCRGERPRALRIQVARAIVGRRVFVPIIVLLLVSVEVVVVAPVVVIVVVVVVVVVFVFERD